MLCQYWIVVVFAYTYVHEPEKFSLVLYGDYSIYSLCQTRTSDVDDVVYVNIVTWSMGCVRVEEAAMGG